MRHQWEGLKFIFPHFHPRGLKVSTYGFGRGGGGGGSIALHFFAKKKKPLFYSIALWGGLFDFKVHFAIPKCNLETSRCFLFNCSVHRHMSKHLFFIHKTHIVTTHLTRRHLITANRRGVFVGRCVFVRRCVCLCESQQIQGPWSCGLVWTRSSWIIKNLLYCIWKHFGLRWSWWRNIDFLVRQFPGTSQFDFSLWEERGDLLQLFLTEKERINVCFYYCWTTLQPLIRK